MNSPFIAAATVLVLPAAAFAGDLALDCSIENPAQPEMTAQLLQEDGASTGLIRTAGGEFKALIYEGPEVRTFLFLGDDYSLNYTVNVATGAYEYFADGSRAAEATGTCVPAAAKVAAGG